MIRIALLLLALLLGCQDNTPSLPQTRAQPPERADVQPWSEATAALPRATLPRAIAGVSLEMSLAEAQTRLGPVACHANRGGFQVCDTEREQIGEARHLELYIYHDRIVSVSYEASGPINTAELLQDLYGRYGAPSLSGMRERDQQGRLHEIYGWKDGDSLYSVRFTWRSAEAQQLVTTVYALWDRKGYQQWEAERQKSGGQEPT